jgi:hypothetical protein
MIFSENRTCCALPRRRRSPLAGTKLDADGWIRRKDGTAEVSLADSMRAGKRVRDLPITIDKLMGERGDLTSGAFSYGNRRPLSRRKRDVAPPWASVVT